MTMTDKILRCFLCLSFLAFSTSLASADIIDSVSDEGIYFDENTGNFEIQNNLIAAGDFYWGNTTIYNQSTVAFEFDLTSVSSISHTLQLYDSGGGGSNNMYNLYGYVGDGTVTPSDNANTSNLLATFATSPSSFTGQGPQYFIDVSSFVNGLLNNGDQYAGFHIVAATSTSFEAFWIEAHIESVPEPTTFTFALIGVVGIGIVRRR